MAKGKQTRELTPFRAWFLVVPDERTESRWYFAWHAGFDRRKDAIAFAQQNRWTAPYRAIRAEVVPVKP